MRVNSHMCCWAPMRFLVPFLLCCYIAKAGDEGASNEDLIIRMLPLNEMVIEFNVSNADQQAAPRAEPEGSQELYTGLRMQGQVIAQLNVIPDLKEPFGHFSLSAAQRVLGFSFGSAEDYLIRPAPPGLVITSPVTMLNPPRDAWWNTTQRDDARLSAVPIKDVSALKACKSIEYIDFGVVGFSRGIWSSLKELATVTSLRGLVVIRTKEFLEFRKNEVVPEIRGLVIHVDSVEQIVELGAAFPNLSYLCLALSNRDLVGKVLKNDVLNKSFPELRAIEFVSSRFASWESWLNSTAGASDQKAGFLPSRFPIRLEWLCMEGSLLTKNEMLQYDHLGISLRFESPLTFGNRRPSRRIDVVFSGMGFAGGGARALDAFERHGCERFWRGKANDR